MTNSAAYLPPGWSPDDYDKMPAETIGGRFACSLCADNRDACERAERDFDRAAALLDRAHALLELIAAMEAPPAAQAGPDDTPEALALIGYAQAFAAIRARIALYLAAAAAR